MAHSKPYYVGDKVTLRSRFYDLDDQPADPDAVTFKVMKPDGTIAPAITASNVAVGVWEAVYIPDTAGWHKWEAKGTGSVQKGDHDSFLVIDDFA